MAEAYDWFPVGELEACVEEFASLRPSGIRWDICLEHEEMPAVIEVFEPERDEPRLHIARTQGGVEVCDMAVGGPRDCFGELDDALAEVLRRLAVRPGMRFRG